MAIYFEYRLNNLDTLILSMFIKKTFILVDFSETTIKSDTE